MTQTPLVTAFNVDHFVLFYRTTEIVALLAQYPNANFRAQLRKFAKSPIIEYEWSRSGGNIVVDAQGLNLIAPESKMRRLNGDFAFGIRLEDTSSNARVIVAEGTVTMKNGVVTATTIAGEPVPYVISTTEMEMTP